MNTPANPANANATPNSDRFVIIMAGGRGERFWPVSREKTPKQLITLLGGRSFLQQAVDRVRPLVPAANILIITNAVQAGTVRQQLPELPAGNVIAEPCGRDTCAAVALGAAIVAARSATGVMAVLPADHVIPEEAKFQQVLADSFARAAAESVMVTIGIRPTEPATGYGYIHFGAPLPALPGAAPAPTGFFTAQRFVEKPPLEKAEEYLRSGQYRWNAGMFIWSVPTVLAGLRAHQPEMAAAAERWRVAAAAGGDTLERVLAVEYPPIKKISIDFALMEQARNVVMADGSFDWDDLGAWPALARHLPADAAGNCAVGDFLQVDAANNIVYDARTRHRTPIAVVGLSDCIIVQTDDAMLVAAKSKAQKIKDLVALLAKHDQYKPLV